MLCTSRKEMYRDGIFKLLRGPGIDFKKSITPAYVAWRASMATLFLLGSSPPCRFSKIPAQRTWRMCKIFPFYNSDSTVRRALKSEMTQSYQIKYFFLNERTLWLRCTRPYGSESGNNVCLWVQTAVCKHAGAKSADRPPTIVFLYRWQLCQFSKAFKVNVIIINY